MYFPKSMHGTGQKTKEISLGYMALSEMQHSSEGLDLTGELKEIPQGPRAFTKGIEMASQAVGKAQQSEESSPK